MKLVLFDLGQTLEDHDVLLPGALQALEDISALRDRDGTPVLLGARVGLRRARPTVLRHHRKPRHPFVFRAGKRAGNAVR